MTALFIFEHIHTTVPAPTPQGEQLWEGPPCSWHGITGVQVRVGPRAQGAWATRVQTFCFTIADVGILLPPWKKKRAFLKHPDDPFTECFTANRFPLRPFCCLHSAEANTPMSCIECWSERSLVAKDHCRGGGRVQLRASQTSPT